MFAKHCRQSKNYFCVFCCCTILVHSEPAQKLCHIPGKANITLFSSFIPVFPTLSTHFSHLPDGNTSVTQHNLANNVLQTMSFKCCSPYCPDFIIPRKISQINDFLKSSLQKSRKPVHRSLKEQGLAEKTCAELNIIFN